MAVDLRVFLNFTKIKHLFESGNAGRPIVSVSVVVDGYLASVILLVH